MKRFLGIVTVVGVVLGGATVGYMKMTEPETYTQEIIETVKEQVIHEPTEEEKLLAERMKIKEQEARLEVKRDMQKDEFEVKSAEYEEQIATLKKEYEAYTTATEAEIKATEAELASFIKAMALSKN